MQWFTHDQLNELKEQDGLLLTNVHGGKVAICQGKGFRYQNVYDFIADYVKCYGLDNLAETMEYENAQDLIECWVTLPLNELDLLDYCANSFDGYEAYALEG